MPVHLDTHNPEIDLTPGTTKSDIVAMLYNNPEYGYRPAEVRDHLDIPDGTATTTLKRLYDQGYLDKTEDGHYHALEHREDLRRYVAGLDQVGRMFGEPAAEGPQEVPDDEDERPGSVDDDAIEDELEELESELE